MVGPRSELSQDSPGLAINRRDTKLASQWLKDSAQRPGTKGGFWSQQGKKNVDQRLTYTYIDVYIYMHTYTHIMIIHFHSIFTVYAFYFYEYDV